MKIKTIRKVIADAAGSKTLFNDLSIGLLTEEDGEQLDGFFREFFEFIFNSELSGDKKPLIEIRMDRVWTKQEFSDQVVMTHIFNSGFNLYQISYKLIRCEVIWLALAGDRHTAMFAAGFAAYALKNNIEIQNLSFTEVEKCYDYFPAIAWLKENRDSEDYDYILGKLYEYVTDNDCLNELLDFYDGLDDMEGKAEFMHYCGEYGTFEQVEMRL